MERDDLRPRPEDRPPAPALHRPGAARLCAGEREVIALTETQQLFWGSLAAGVVFAGAGIVAAIDRPVVPSEITIYSLCGLFAILALSHLARRLRGASDVGPFNWVLFAWVGLRLAVMAALALLLSGSVLALFASLDLSALLFRAAIPVLIVGSLATFASTAVLNIVLAIRGPLPNKVKDKPGV